MRPEPPPAASPTATPRGASLSRSDLDNHEIDPKDSRSWATTNASATATITSSIAKPAESKRNTCVIPCPRRAENAVIGKKSASSASTGSVSHAARRNRRRYVNREATSAPMSAGSASSIPSNHLCDASPTFANPGRTSRSICMTSGWSLGSRGSPNAAAGSSWWPGSTRTTRTPAPVSISSTLASPTHQPFERRPAAARASYASAPSRTPGSSTTRRSRPSRKFESAAASRGWAASTAPGSGRPSRSRSNVSPLSRTTPGPRQLSIAGATVRAISRETSVPPGARRRPLITSTWPPRGMQSGISSATRSGSVAAGVAAGAAGSGAGACACSGIAPSGPSVISPTAILTDRDAHRPQCSTCPGRTSGPSGAHRRPPATVLVDRYDSPARQAKSGNWLTDRSRCAQATATPSNAAARTPRCANSARNGTGSTSVPRPWTPG